MLIKVSWVTKPGLHHLGTSLGWNIENVFFTWLVWCSLLAGPPAETVDQNLHPYPLYVTLASEQQLNFEREHPNMLVPKVSKQKLLDIIKAELVSDT